MTHLDYYSAGAVDPRAIRLNRIFFRVALSCAILPMAIGLSVLALYSLFAWELMVPIGLFMLFPIGPFAVLAGIGFAITWCVRQHIIAKRLSSPTRWGTGILILLLLLANFPVAYFCAYVGSRLVAEGITVVIFNNTDADLTNVTVHAARRHKLLRIIPSGGHNVAAFHLRHCKSIRVHVEQDGVPKEFTFPSPPSQYYLKIHVKPGLEFEHEFVPRSSR